MRPTKGKTYRWRGVKCEVIRVASNGAWADLKVWSPSGSGSWRKRQQLPLGDDFVEVEG